MSNVYPKDFSERPAGALQFRQADTNSFQTQEQDGKHAVTLTAFSGTEFYHWYWGRCIFDRSGAVIPFAKIPLDFNHRSDEPIGYLDTFGGEKELTCNGYLVPFQEGDRASEILYKKKAGVPYQCSVTLGDKVFEYEYVSPRTSAEVNGQTVFGEEDGIIIFRKFEVIGVAVCLYGSDSSTAVFNKGERTMAQEQKSSPDPQAGRELYKSYVQKFGSERGGRYFADGLTEEQASAQYIEEMGKDFALKDARIAELEVQVAEFGKKNTELETQMANAKPSDNAEFQRLQEENKRFKAAGVSGGGEAPVSGVQEPMEQAKVFSPLPENLHCYNAKVQEQLARR